MKFDHDFINHKTLEKMAKEPQHRKITLTWNTKDVVKVISSMYLSKDEPYKYVELPLSNYTSSNYNALMANGQHVGFSMFSGFSYNERSMLSLDTVDPDIEIGNEVKLIWGEEDGGTRKLTVEHHKQTEIRTIVSPVPYSEIARSAYAEGWRTGKA